MCLRSSVILSHPAHLVRTMTFIWSVQNGFVCVCHGTSYHRANGMHSLAWVASYSRKLCPWFLLSICVCVDCLSVNTHASNYCVHASCSCCSYKQYCGGEKQTCVCMAGQCFCDHCCTGMWTLYRRWFWKLHPACTKRICLHHEVYIGT